MFDLVLFDLDGTLVDTAPEIADAVNDWLRALGLEPMPEVEVRDRIGWGTRELLLKTYAAATGQAVAALRRSGAVQKLQDSFMPHYEAHCGRRSRVYPQVIEALEALAAAKRGLAVLTNKEERYTGMVLAAHGLRRHFALVVCGDTLEARKPDPRTVEYCHRYFGVPLERMLLIGDSGIDVRTARNAGIAVWTVPYGYNGGEDIAAARPDRIVGDLLEAAQMVLQPQLQVDDLLNA